MNAQCDLDLSISHTDFSCPIRGVSRLTNLYLILPVLTKLQKRKKEKRKPSGGRDSHILENFSGIGKL